MKTRMTWIAVACAAVGMAISSGAWAIGGASGPHVGYPTTGKIAHRRN